MWMLWVYVVNVLDSAVMDWDRSDKLGYLEAMIPFVIQVQLRIDDGSSNERKRDEEEGGPPGVRFQSG